MDDDFRAAHYLHRAEQRGSCLCLGNGSYYPSWHSDGRKTGRIAHLILRVYAGQRPRGAYSLHSCDNKACINPDHLRWGTQKENIDEACVRGRMPSPPLVDQGKRARDGVHPWARLKPIDVKCIRDRLAKGETQQFIAADFGVTFQQISKIKLGQRWAHLP
jgi:hypothetical protein